MTALAELDQEAFEANALGAVRLLKAMANEKRLMILCRLGEGEKSVGELARLIGLGQSPLSQHLAQLRADGLVATRRQSQTIFYRLESREAVAVIRTLAEHFSPPHEATKA